jgi:hypothetical protein
MQLCVIWRHCSVILKDGLRQTTNSVSRPRMLPCAPGCSLCVFLNSKGMYRKEIALTYSWTVLSISPIQGHSQRNHSITADQEYYSGSNSLVCRGRLNVMLWTVYQKVAFARKHYGKSRRCYRTAIQLQLAFLLISETRALDGGGTEQYTATSDGLV